MKRPKNHGLEDHLMNQMEQMDGIGDFLEDFVEQSHQTGARDEIRTRGLDRAKAFLLHSNQEYKSNKVPVVLAKEDVKNRTSRKRKRRGAALKKHESKLSQEEKRLKSLKLVESGIYSMIDDYRGLGGIKRQREITKQVSQE